MEMKMPVFMKYPDIEGRINEADRFDFSQLTTSHDVDDGLLLVGLRWGQPVVDDGLLLPAVRMDDAEASIKDGTSNTVLFSEMYGGSDGEYVLTGIEHGADDSQTSHPGGANMLFGDGSVRSTDTSAVATLLDFEWSSSDTTDRLVVVTDADPAGAIAGVIIAATTDNNRIDDGADYSGSHALYQDVFIPTLDTGTLIIAHEGYWY